MVLIYHLAIPAEHAAAYGIEYYAVRLTWSGWGGVDIFFALSGFLVGGILIDQRDEPGVLKRFFARRIFRILPLYLVVVASFYMARAVVKGEAWLLDPPLPWWSYVTLTHNFVAASYVGGASYLGPTWSLAVEIQIYIVLALWLGFAPRRFLVWGLLAAAIIAPALRAAFVLSDMKLYGYFLLPARIDGACLGVIAAMIVRNETILGKVYRYRAGLWLFAGTLFAGAMAVTARAGPLIMSLGEAAYGHFAFGLCAAIAIILLAANRNGIANRALRVKPLVFVGAISYGIYLLHVPVIALTRIALKAHDRFALDSPSSLFATLVGLVLTILLAWLSWTQFERPLNQFAHRWLPRPRAAGPAETADPSVRVLA